MQLQDIVDNRATLRSHHQTAISYQSLAVRDPLALFSPFAEEEGSVFFDSATPFSPIARYSFIGIRPWAILYAKNNQITFQGKTWTENPFKALKRLIAPYYHQQNNPDLPPWQGGVAGYFGYDLNTCLENIPSPKQDDLGFPDLALGFYDTVISFDHHLKKAWIICNSSGGHDPHARLQEIKAKIDEIGDLPELKAMPPQKVSDDIAQRPYAEMLQKTIDYIYAGDIYQANITRRFQADLPKGISSFDLYRHLRAINPAPFAGYMHFKDVTLVSASPERFISVHNGAVETCPIKGTRPRGKTPQEDDLIKEELKNSLKDTAENIMIVDLLRNDLSRVCLPHTVKTPDLLRVESYATVHHLVSTITGTLKPGLTPVDLLESTFPGGSITGAPKIRAMEIIAELEPTHRGPYCGCMGYIGFDGTMDTNIIIRTYAIKGQRITFQTGGGIVADSQPLNEFLETETKALALKWVLDQ